MKSGDNILVHAAASGVGTALLRLAKLNGIRCFATAGSTEKVNFCLDLGAYKAFNYKDGPFAPKVLEATEGLRTQKWFYINYNFKHLYVQMVFKLH